jgi:hypothetical protein
MSSTPAGFHLRSRFAPFLLVALGAMACSGDPVPAGAVRGELVRYVASFHQGDSAGDGQENIAKPYKESYALRPIGSDREVPLTFEADPGALAGLLLDVWGREREGAIAVERFQVVGDPAPVETVQRGIIDGAAYRPRSFAFVLVDTSGGRVPVALSSAAASERLFGTTPGTTPSVRQYYIEASYGRQDVTGQVFGPLPFAMTGCNTTALAQALTPMIEGVFDHYLFYIHPRNTACSWTGLAQGGRPERPSKNTWYNAASGCVVLVQEPGHNLGMSHSSSMKCPSSPFVDEPSTVCSHQEYGDRYDPMGGGCGHMNAFQKAYQGWFDRCNLVEATASGTFTLLPVEVACDGVQALQVPMPRTRSFSHAGGITELTHYYLELRAPLGMDHRLTQQTVVQVRVSNDTRSRTQRGVRTWFLDMNPGTAALDGLGAGESFADPTGSPRFIVESLGPNSASVRVEIDGGGTGAPTCFDGTVLEGSGPGPDSCAAGPSTAEGTPPPIPGGPVPRVSDDGPAGWTCQLGSTRGGGGGGLVLCLVALYYLGRTRVLRPRRSASCAR